MLKSFRVSGHNIQVRKDKCILILIADSFTEKIFIHPLWPLLSTIVNFSLFIIQLGKYLRFKVECNAKCFLYHATLENHNYGKSKLKSIKLKPK